MPLPLILIMGIARADRDRAGVDIAVVNVPAFLAGVSRSTAGGRDAVCALGSVLFGTYSE